jgi:hypothetical protein
MVRSYRFVAQKTGRLTGCLLLCALVASSQAEASLEQDARLQQPIKLSVAGVPLRDLFQRIQKQTGVSLQVDAALADCAAIVYVPNRPLREWMVHLATAFHAEWRADGSHPPTYTLHPLPLAGETPREKLTRERLKNLPRRLQLLYEPPVEEPVDDEDHQRAIEVYQSGFRKERLPLRLLGQLTPAEIDALRAGKTLEFSSRTDPRFDPSWLTEWKLWLENAIGYLAEVNQSPKGDAILGEYYASVRGVRRGDEVRLRVSCDPETAAIQCAVGIFAQGELIYGESFTLDEEPPEPEGFSWHDFSLVLPKDHPWRGLEFEPFDADDAERSSQSPVRRVRLPALPSLDSDWFAYEAAVILRIAQAAGKPFIAEYGWTLRSLDKVYGLPSFVYRLAASGYEWQVQKDWVIMRYRDPREARPRCIPKRALRQWFFKPNQRGVLTIHDLLSVARYVPDAADLYIPLAAFGINHRVVFEGELPYPYVVITDLLALPQTHHGLLYAVSSLEPLYERPEAFQVLVALTDAQRRALLAGQTIPLESLSPRALGAVLDLAYFRDRARAPAFWQNAPPKGTLRLISREQPVQWLTLPRNYAAKAHSIDSAKEAWSEIREQLGYDPDALYRNYGANLCCLRQWQLEVTLGGLSQAFTLLEDHTPLLQRNPSLRTPK